MTNKNPIAHSSEMKWLLREAALSSVTACAPSRLERRLYSSIKSRQLVKAESKRHRAKYDEMARRMTMLIGDQYSSSEIDQHVSKFLEMRLEDHWTRSRLGLGTDSGIQTEVRGLENLTPSLDQGKGAVIWGMSFCGTLFSKIALAQAGVQLTHLSLYNHGLEFPVSWLGKHLIARIYCRPENRYLAERIQIPENRNPRYVKRIYEALKHNACVWINAEVPRPVRPITVDFLNRKADLPPGAPRIALKHGTALLPAYTQRLGPFRYALNIGAPITPDSETGNERNIQSAAQAYADQLAARIRETPGEWDWDGAWADQLVSSEAADG